LAVSAPILERARLLEVVAGYLAEATSGHGRLVFVAGEAGAGKTAFVTRIVAEAGVEAVVGACDGSLTPAPLGPLVDMLPALPSGVWPPEASRQEVFARLAAALRAADGPRIVVFEDLHWADEATLDLVRYLVRRVHLLRALVMVTYRPQDLRSDHPLRILLGDAATAAGARRLDLPPLSISAVAQLIEQSRAVARDPVEIHRVTGGNPFFVTEVLATGGDGVPPTVRDAVLARTARLSSRARAVLDAAAVAGPRVELDLLDAVLPDSVDALDEALERGVLRLTGNTVGFRHELARIVVAEQVPALRRMALHRRVLSELESRADQLQQVAAVPRRGPPHARMAHHAEGAGDAEAVLRHAPAAAAQAAALGAHLEAVEQYRRALRCADGVSPPERAAFLAGLAYECYLTDRIDDALDARQEELAIWQSAGEAVGIGETHRWLSRLRWFGGRNDLSEQHAALAVEALTGIDGVPLAMAYSNHAQLRMLDGDVVGTRRWARLTLDLLDRLPRTAEADEVRIHVLTNLGSAELVAGDVPTGVAMLTESREKALAGDLHEHAARAYVNLVASAVIQHRHTDAVRDIAAGLSYCTERDLDAWTGYLQGWEALVLLDSGDAAAAIVRAERTLARPRISAISQFVALCVLARARARLGADDWAGPLRDATSLAAATGEPQRIGPATAAQCEIAWILGDHSKAHDHAAQVWPSITSDSSSWRRGSVATWLRRPHVPAIRLEASPYAAELSDRWEDAAIEWERLGSPFAQALALARGETRQGLARSAQIFDRIGATAAAARARAISRSHGWAPPRGLRATTRAHPAGLTQREEQVLALVAEGLSDAAIAERLFLSARTVEHHVSSILAKLGVASRRQAVAAAKPGTGGREIG
jgi:DNA-binding CsgD family transcriptional regulator/tetratricopeptide (TPR) repeat protein